MEARSTGAGSCRGACREPGADREAQRRVCHPGAGRAASPPDPRAAELERLRSLVKRLNAEAGQLRLDLHDLAEDLPHGWERIMEVARRTAEKYAELTEARRQLQALEDRPAGGAGRCE